jgi:hypothetical protein
MLSKITLSFLVLATTAAIVACSNLGMTQGVNVGPNFPSKTLYATNSNENAISIYSDGTSESKIGGGPAFEIGGANTTLNGPQYLAFDRRGQLWVTNYNPSTKNAVLIEFAPQATGDVDPLNSAILPGRPRGIAFTPRGPSPLPSSSAPPAPQIMVIADVDSSDVYPSRILLFNSGATSPYQSIGGAKPRLSLPGGVAIDRSGHVYVANIQGATVEQFALPTPTASPKPTATPKPTPSPSPTASPSGSPSPTPKPTASPTPSPTPSPVNIAPRFTINAKNGMITPTGVALDSSGNIYIVDQGRRGAKCSASDAPAILVFPPYNKRIPYTKPIREIQGCNTMLYQPTDIKLNSAGVTYVADSTSAGKGIILIFPAGASGNVTSTNYTSPGAVTAIGNNP